MPIEFVNRAYELDLICKPGAPRFVVVDGAAGYGKSYLLHEVRQVYKEKREGWKVALVDLKSSPQMTSTDLIEASACIANAVIQQFTSTRGNLPGIPESPDEGTIAGVLTPFLAGQGANILLLFDGVEVLARDTSAWLKRLVAALDRGLQRVPRELRVAFAGRYAGDWGRGTPYPLPTLSLSPFDRVAVWDMVEQVAGAANVQAAPDYLSELTWWVLRISGGHPRGICDVLDVVCAAGFIFPDLKFAFLDMQFDRNGRRGVIFDLCIERIVDEMLCSVPVPLRDLLAAISPIRRFDPELLVTLLDHDVVRAPRYQSGWELIQASLRDCNIEYTVEEEDQDAKYQAVWELVEALLKTRLISPPTHGDPMFSDQIARRMLAIQMEIREPDHYREVNKRVLEIFHDLALGSIPLDREIRRAAIVESLYHALQLEPEDASSAEVQVKLKQRLIEYLTAIQNLRDVMQLKAALAQDRELNDLIDRRAGITGFQTLLEVIDRLLDH